MAEPNRLDAYADWLRANQDKAGTPEFVKVADAYRALRTEANPGNPASAVMSGANSSIGTMFGAPVDAVNWGLKKVGLGSERPFLGSDQINGAMRDWGMIRDNPGYPGLTKFGENLGAGVLTTLSAGAAAPALMSRGATTVGKVAQVLGPTGGAASTLGREAIGAAAQTLGGEAAKAAGAGPMGQMLAEIVAGGVPGAVAGAGKQVVRAWGEKTGPADAMGRSPSRQSFDRLEALGIDPSPSLVGNKSAVGLELSAAGMPVVGSRVQKRIDDSFRQYQGAFYNATDEISPRLDPTLQQAPERDLVGARMRIGANDGTTNMKGYFKDQYDQGYGPDTIPSDTLVDPKSLRAEVKSQSNPLNAESQATQKAVGNYVREEVNPAIVTEQGPTNTVSPGAPEGVTPSGAPIDRSGIPFQTARRTRTEAIYDAEGGKMAGGAIDQVRGALTDDMHRAIMEDPRMIEKYPNPADRQALIDEFKRIDTEFAASRATDISPGGGTVIGDRFYTGGDQRALDQVANAQSDASAFALGSEPGRMAVLQRNVPDQYPGLAADTVRQKAQALKPRDDVNVSPSRFGDWWQGMSVPERLTFTNEGFDPRRSIPLSEMQAGPAAVSAPVMDRMDLLAQTGKDFGFRGVEVNSPRTAQTLSGMAFLASLFTNPKAAIGGLASAGIAGKAASSRTLAEILAGVGETTPEQIIRGTTKAGARTALTPEDQYGP